MKFLLIIFLFFSISSYADNEPVFVGQHDNWEVYTQIEAGQKVCFMVSSPMEKAGNYKRRGHSYLWVRNISKNIDEISVTPGYKYKTAISPEIAVYRDLHALDQIKRNNLLDKARSGLCSTDHKENHQLSLIEQEQAWARETETDTQLVHNMQKGYYAVVIATSMKDTCSTDIYSLIGFIRAYKQMKSLCE
ncbi:MAG: hypothetical protein HRK26_03015 [Rickettsiaceae bacterium H1]|nr:hypothetical protein [Rickettsiaceae bacterium H1]